MFPGRREALSELEVVSTVEEDEMSDLASLEIDNKYRMKFHYIIVVLLLRCIF